MPLPPALVIHGLVHARLALSPGRPVTLLSAPNAAAFAGCGWWRALVGLALAEYPGAAAEDVLDCGAAPGRALEALSVGCRLLVLAPCPAFADIAERAARLGAAVLPDRPAAVDLAERGAERRLAAWLSAS